MGRRADGALVGAGDATAQARQVYANMRTAMESVGGTLANIVKVAIFLVSEDDLAGRGRRRTSAGGIAG